MFHFSLLKKFLNKSKGFTLIEIILVIAIIGITAAFLIGNYASAKQRARDSQRKSDLNLVQAAMEQYKADYGNYPCFNTSASECSTDLTSSSLATEGWALISSMSQIQLPTKYITTLPIDPTYKTAACSSTTPGYLYWHSAGRQQYVLFANLENTKDPDVVALKPAPNSSTLGQCVSGTSPCAQYKITAGICAGATYNYWVTNP